MFTLSAQAQYASDALRFSQTNIGGTARFQALAGAQIAVGGDIGNLSGNPAGLGFFRSSDFSITPSIRLGQTESKGLGNLYTSNRDNFNIGNIGFVVTQLNQDYSGNYVKDGWVSYSFGLSINRTNNFFEERYFKGVNNNNSMTDFFAETANRYGLSLSGDIENIEDMAYSAYLINYDSTYTAASMGSVTQKQYDRIKGSQSEWNIGFGANYSNMLYVGASLGIGTMKYGIETLFEESDIMDTINHLTDFRLNEELQLNGSSVNLKAGLIFRPVDFVRLGISLQTPNYYTIEELYSTDIRSTVNDTALRFDPLNYVFSYKLNTPLRINYGLAFFIGKYGFISADIEQLNYSKSKVRTEANDMDFASEQNLDIRNSFKKTYNYRLGAEARLGAISLRGGYAYYGDPYQHELIDRSRRAFSGGLGYRVEDYYFDLTFVNTEYSSLYTPYTLNNGSEPIINNQHKINQILFTVGTKF